MSWRKDHACQECDCTTLALGSGQNRSKSPTEQLVLFLHHLRVHIIRRTWWSDRIYAEREQFLSGSERRPLFMQMQRSRWNRFFFWIFTLLPHKDLVNLSLLIFASFNVNTKSAGRTWHEPFSSRGMVSPLAPGFGWPCWDYASLPPGMNPWGLSFAQLDFCCKVWTQAPVLSRADLTMSVVSKVAGQIPQRVPWGLQPLGRKLPSFCFSFPSVENIFGIGWFSNEMH